MRFRFWNCQLDPHTTQHTTTSTGMADSTEPMNVDGDAAMADKDPVVDVPALGASMEEEKEEDTCR